MTNPEVLYQAILGQEDLARRAIRGDLGYKEAGFQNPAAALAKSTGASGAGQLQRVPINYTASGTRDLIAGAAGVQIQVYSLVLWSEKDQNLELFDGANSLMGPLTAFPAASGLILSNVGEPWFRITAGNPLRLSQSATGQVSGFVLYRSV